MAKGLQIAQPPQRRNSPVERYSVQDPAPQGEKFSQVAEHEKVQFNKRVTRSTADGYEMLAIRTRKKVPDLLAEGLELLEQRYGKS